ncbi:MAG: hypothetical protein QOD38_925 [Acidimicrobiaceae bacterium]
MSWRVNAEPVVFLGGGRALLLQVAHPKVAAGVEQHSTYATDPWGRLFRTVDVMAKLAFAAPEVSVAQSRWLERMHRRVAGVTEEGDRYTALDPDLLLWVWATLSDTALLMYESVRRPLSAERRVRYYEESKLVAHACGVPPERCPSTLADFNAYFDRVVADDLRVTDAGRAVAHATMVPPLPGRLGSAAARPNQLVTAGLLPPKVRAGYGFEWSQQRERELQRLLHRFAVAHRLAPRSVRELGMRYVVQRDEPLRFAWLQRRGAELTASRMSEIA